MCNFSFIFVVSFIFLFFWITCIYFSFSTTTFRHVFFYGAYKKCSKRNRKQKHAFSYSKETGGEAEKETGIEIERGKQKHTHTTNKQKRNRTAKKTDFYALFNFIYFSARSFYFYFSGFERCLFFIMGSVKTVRNSSPTNDAFVFFGTAISALHFRIFYLLFEKQEISLLFNGECLFNRGCVSVPLFIAFVICCWLRKIRSHPRSFIKRIQNTRCHALTVF